MIITTLGTSHGDPTYCRFNSSTLFRIGGNKYLVDAGMPVDALMIRSGKDVNILKGVFITHMHHDHVGGLPGLIKTLIKWKREDQHTDIFMPERNAVAGLQTWLGAMHVAYPSEVVDLHVAEVGEIYNDGLLSVKAVGNEHLSVGPERFTSFSYVLEAEGRRVVYTGDLSSDFSDFPQIAQNEPCDLCICEAAHYDMDDALAALSTFPIKKLIFNHIGNRWHGDGESELEKLVSRLPFPCEIAHDGGEYEI